MITLEEYIDYYEKYKKCFDTNYYHNKPLTRKRLESKYADYIRKKESKDSKYQKDEEWENVKEIVYARDNSKCQFLANISFELKKEFYKENSVTNPLLKIIDPAHIIRKVKSKECYYDSDNVVCLNRLVHTRLDNYQNPITGKNISKEETDYFWKIIVGEDNYNFLYKKYMENSI